MKKRITLVQMASELGNPEKNYTIAGHLLEKAIAENPDIIVFPETLNVGFFPKNNLLAIADDNGQQTKAVFGQFAHKHHVNIVAGSVANKKNGKVYNTAFVFDRQGNCVCEYDKIHGFSPAGEHDFFAAGTNVVNFILDEIACSLVICYDIRFPEIIRTAALQGVDVLFVPAQWPLARKQHWVTLTTARAIENQMYVCAVNGCGWAGETRYGGNSVLISPWGEEIIHLGAEETIGTGEIDLSVIRDIRNSINVFRARKPALYKL